MRFKRAQLKDSIGWHNWFAWHPVSIRDQIVWLETVERCSKYYYYWVHEYRFPQGYS